MTWLLDTNVVSEVRKGDRCNPGVARWWSKVDEGDLYLSVIVIGEIRKGVESMRRRDPAQAAVIDRWLEDVRLTFAGRILPVSEAVAQEWGRMAALRPLPLPDGLIAATARVHDLTLVTRDTNDIAGTGVRTLDPFRSAVG